MSVLIKGMEMPTSCENCELAKHFDGYNENDCPFNAFSFYDCPLVALPDHGDLIDRDALKEPMESVCMGIMAGTDSYNAPLKTIDDAPVIIPAERSEE